MIYGETILYCMMVQMLEPADVGDNLPPPPGHHLLQKWLRGEVGIESLKEWLIHVHTSEVQTSNREIIYRSVTVNERLERHGWPK